MNHDFVSAFERLRRDFNLWDMHDPALRRISAQTGLEFERLRTARHLRNALAHDQPVNQAAVERHLEMLRGKSVSQPVEQSCGTTASSEPANSGRHDQRQRRVFRLHAWRNDELEAQMLAHGFVSVGGSEIGDMSSFSDAEAIRLALSQSMPDRKPAAIRIFVGYWRRFLWDAQSGDVVVLPTQSQGVAVGLFAGPYFYVESAAELARHRRLVAWQTVGIDRAAFSAEVNRVLSGRHTIQTVKSELHEEILGAGGLA